MAGCFALLAAAAFAAPKPPQGEAPSDDESTVIGIVAFRYSWVAQHPGADGKLGRISDTLASEANPWGRDLEDPAGKDDIFSPPGEIVVPAERPVVVQGTSSDYLHGFTVKALKLDELLVPGTTRKFWFRPAKVATLPVTCSPGCGEGHETMKATLRIVPRAEFDAWLAARATGR